MSTLLRPTVIPYGQDPAHPAALPLAQRLSRAFDPTTWGREASPWSASFHLMGWIDQQVARDGPIALTRVAQWLTQENALDLPDEHGDTPLMGAIQGAPDAWRAALVQQLLHAGANPSHRVPGRGMRAATTPLILAVQFNTTDVVDLLLDAGASTNPKNPVDRQDRTVLPTTALNEAVSRGRLPLVNRLLDAGAPVDAPDAQQRTPLLLAVGAMTPHLDVLDRLLAAGASVHTTLLDGEPLPFVLTMGSVQEAHATVIGRLLAAGYPVDARSPLSGSTLMGALCNLDTVHPAAIDVLLDAGADPNAPNDHGNAPLHFAATLKPETWPLVERLVRAGGRLDQANAEGITPVQFLDADLQRRQRDPGHDERVKALAWLRETADLVGALHEEARRDPRLLRLPNAQRPRL